MSLKQELELLKRAGEHYGKRARWYHRLSIAEKMRIKSEYLNGSKTRYHLAREFGVTPKAIYAAAQTIRRNGIEGLDNPLYDLAICARCGYITSIKVGQPKAIHKIFLGRIEGRKKHKNCGLFCNKKRFSEIREKARNALELAESALRKFEELKVLNEGINSEGARLGVLVAAREKLCAGNRIVTRCESRSARL